MSGNVLRTVSDGGVSNVLEKSTCCGRWKQYFTCFVFSLLCMSTGLTEAWSSPMTQILQSDDSPVGKLDDSQIGTLRSLSQFAGIAGVLLVILSIIKFGTKVSGQLMGVLALTGWIVVIFAPNRYVLFAGRFVSSMTNIGADVVSSFYLSEIADDCRRGTLIATAMFAISLGSLCGTALGVICDNYQHFNAICTIPCVVFFLLCHLIPDSPSHFIRVGKTKDACKSYIWFRGVSMEAAQRHVKRMESFKRTKFKPAAVFEESSNRRAILIMVFVLAYPILCGTTVISSFTSSIFQNANVSWKPNESALLLASIGFISSLLGAIFVENAGRRFLVISSFSAMSVGLYAVTIYFVMRDGLLMNILPPEWLIFAGLGFFTSGYTVGVKSVAQVMGAELVPAGTKGVLWMFAGIAALIASVVTIQLYTVLTNHVPYYVNFLQESVFATMAIFISSYVVLETKGKSLAQITAELRGEIYEPAS